MPYLADFVAVDLAATGHLAHASTVTLQERVDSIIRHFTDTGSNAKFGLASVVGSGEVEVCFDVEREAGSGRAAQLLDMGIRSLISAPLTIRGQHVGALTLLRENLPSRCNFGPEDRALAEELARRISLAIEIDRLFAPTRTRLATKDIA